MDCPTAAQYQPRLTCFSVPNQHRILQSLRDEGQMTQQPVRRRHRLLLPTGLPKPMPDTDLAAFFLVIDAVRDRLIFLFMLRCGLRVSEVCALAWDAIDLDAGTVRMN